jgi:hypothetical protein
MAVALLACAAAVVCVVVSRGLTGSHASTSSSPESGEATVETVAVSSDGSPSLPFTVSGVTSPGAVVEVSEGAEAMSLKDSWTFGGDYSKIGSFPIAANTVFGSTTDDPDSLVSYVAALIGQDSGTALEETQDPTDFYEPQDGTGDASRIVWRSSRLGDSSAFGVDDWRIQTWDAETGETIVLGTAADLNGAGVTRTTYGEVVPTANATTAYFASNRVSGDSQETVVLSAPLDGSSSMSVLDVGSYPAAVDGGVLYATDLASPDHLDSYATLRRATVDGALSDVLAVTSDDGTWGVSGVWAHDGFRAVAFTDGDSSSGTYVGLWADDFRTPLCWVHVASPTIVGSLNGEWFVWGSGSQSSDAGMYAYDWSSGCVAYLGSCAGYSRPAIASDSNVVMVPRSEGTDSAVSYEVGTLG